MKNQNNPDQRIQESMKKAERFFKRNINYIVNDPDNPRGGYYGREVVMQFFKSELTAVADEARKEAVETERARSQRDEWQASYDIEWTRGYIKSLHGSITNGYGYDKKKVLKTLQEIESTLAKRLNNMRAELAKPKGEDEK
jgi:hypothetical protein